jgi:hypothetical protein
MRRWIVVLAVAVVGLTSGACGRADEPRGPGGPGGGTPAEGLSSVAALAVPEEDANLVLWVSNQSFIDDPVGVKVLIDDSLVVARSFAVEGQHNWIRFPIRIAPGEHEVRAIASTGVSRRERFTIPATGLRYAVLDYWYYVDDDGRYFTWRIQSTPIGFD